jgi:hypothetical protein
MVKALRGKFSLMRGIALLSLIRSRKIWQFYQSVFSTISSQRPLHILLIPTSSVQFYLKLSTDHIQGMPAAKLLIDGIDFYE